MSSPKYYRPEFFVYRLEDGKKIYHFKLAGPGQYARLDQKDADRVLIDTEWVLGAFEGGNLRVQKEKEIIAFVRDLITKHGIQVEREDRYKKDFDLKGVIGKIKKKRVKSQEKDFYLDLEFQTEPVIVMRQYGSNIKISRRRTPKDWVINFHPYVLCRALNRRQAILEQYEKDVEKWRPLLPTEYPQTRQEAWNDRQRLRENNPELSGFSYGNVGVRINPTIHKPYPVIIPPLVKRHSETVNEEQSAKRLKQT